MLVKLLVGLLALGAPARAETVDRVVAVVDGEPILASDLALDEALRDIDPSPIPFWRASADPLETAIEVVLIRHLASDVALYVPSKELVNDRIFALRESFESRAAWERFLEIHGLGDPVGLEAVVRRRVTVERYLLRNVQASPSNASSWLAECRVLLDQKQRRPMKIRRIAEGSPR